MSNQLTKTSEFLSRRLILGTTIAGALIFFIVGIIFWGGFNTAMEATNNLEFCISCHEMENNVYQEYKPTIHYSNRTGVRASCPDCHVPDPWIHKVVRKIKASNEIYHKLVGTVDTPEKFDNNRLLMAKRVWNTMKETDSRECRNCHNLESMNPKFQKPRARKQHLNAFETGQTCIDCHKGIAHKSVREELTDEEIETLEAPNPEFAREIPELFKEGLEEIKIIEAKQKIEESEKQKIVLENQQAEIDAAVEQALQSYKKQSSKQTSGKSSSADNNEQKSTQSSNINIDWSKAANREVTLFYPGESSLEWVMNGRDHGGARPFIKGGDRCTTCHDNETADMGKKIVTGKTAETTPIPNKRGSVPVSIDSTYDKSFLYLRFSWPDTKHVPVPFIEGGKMDPENPMKLAIMFATDEVEYADRTGCWATCHHDAKSMPHSPDKQTIEASEYSKQYDFSQGITKYLKESRTKIEVKGKRGKKRGGWDKLKEGTELQAELDAQHFMDIIRYKSGDGSIEDGHILAERKMGSNHGTEFEAKLKNNRWTLIMKRKLISDRASDISLSKDQVYNFGFAIHDDYTNARYHHVSLGYKLGFDNADVEINAKTQ